MAHGSFLDDLYRFIDLQKGVYFFGTQQVYAIVIINQIIGVLFRYLFIVDQIDEMGALEISSNNLNFSIGERFLSLFPVDLKILVQADILEEVEKVVQI